MKITAQTGEEIDLNNIIGINNDNIFNKYETNYDLLIHNKNKGDNEKINNND